MSNNRRRAWDHDGYFIVPQLLDPKRVRELAEACDHVLSQVRLASAATGHTTTHIKNLLSPEFYVDRPELLSRLMSYASSRAILTPIQDLSLESEGALNLRGIHYFHEPSARDFDGEWHRDGDEAHPAQFDPNGTVKDRATLLRFRVAFAWDDHLEIIPGSHRRADTPEELRARRTRQRDVSLPSAVRIVLEPGDACVFDTWTIHRGRYRSQNARRTLDLVFGFGERPSAFYTYLSRMRAPLG